ncbi:MAG: ABC transporter permease [Prevotellaceae bacterium]|jgi:putative ABC transport system permease protein|nr:ABC transporter permease [Prevotellaceae bacterium]
MKHIFRNFVFVLKRFKASSILNILGLSVAFAVFFVIIVQTHYDFSFDGNFEKADNIYLIGQYNPHRDIRRVFTNTQTPKMIAEKYPEVKNYCFMYDSWYNTVTFDVQDEAGNKHKYEESVTRASEGFLEIFTPKIIAGDARQAFTEHNKAMLTKSLAQKFFGNADPLGKVISYHNSNNPITIVAVCEDFPDNCSLSSKIYMMQSEHVEGEWSYTSYLEIADGGRDKILNSLNSNEAFREEQGENLQEEQDNDKWLFELTALRDIHLKYPAKGKGSLTTTVSLLAVGILLLIISYINFVNFTVSMAPVRLKSLNIRRIMGENTLFQKFSIAMESVFMSLLAVLISILFIHYLSISVVKEFFQANILLSENLGLFMLMAGWGLIMGFVAGIYPALYSTAFKPAMVLNGSFLVSTGSKMLKNTLIVVQFVSAIILVIVAGFIKVQHDYMQDKSWKTRKENIVHIPLNQLNEPRVFESELKKNPDIFDVTFAEYLPGAPRMMGWNTGIDDTPVNMTVWPVHDNYLQFFGINIVEGSNFERSDISAKRHKMIVNQTLVKKHGFSNDIIGKEITFFGNKIEIIGIMEDFNFESLREPVRPMSLIIGRNFSNRVSKMFVKINGQNTAKALEYIRETYKQFSRENEPIEITYLDETFNQLYKQENNLAKLISIFGLVTIIVTIMGVYGLTLFNVKSKRKTIAIHKIHGASIMEVITLLNRDFIIQFAIAYIVAVPLTYIIVNRWLENFAYKTPIHWWIFVAGGLFVFIITALTVSWQSYKAAITNPVDGIKNG